MNNLSTSEKILEAAMSLFSEKGYKAVTTKDIANAAGVSEMTIFRHFQKKRYLFEKAFDKYVFSPKLKTLFDSGLEWDLEKDLMKISSIYQEMLCRNERIILMQLKNNELIFRLDSPLRKFPNELNKLLADYFYKMKEKGVIDKNPEILAINFLSSNFGIFTSLKILEKYNTDVDINSCITNFVKTFTKGIMS
ncbi:TetR/AcrR family transcriptional regulator [Paramaledivibacter caminithermalis]|jgi:AcrR family transcriptional regulator|uniref:Transcriptional regulator, TetR family n=1 Tax=Paramaledivibacter caminithermalis (strain DSM 15212 / CIP 107654 / DViRD3) TaxID=1121301 RepID=A0A1M6MT26_PARC5|nr:TetR/AcrR family transcriptional regulator [Paramaledivibacter caminithermalis]SHJ86631.1 transcriptional regulator, TetR family [Paramaledivibacter caminithermalis DSM 15212]